MKKVFYIYWIWYLLMMLINNVGIIAPLWVSNLFKVSLVLNFVYLGFYPMFLIVDNFLADTDKYQSNAKLRKVDSIYLEAIMVSFMVRGLLFVFSVYKLGQRWDILAWIGVCMIIYYIFEVRFKIRIIEKNLL